MALNRHVAYFSHFDWSTGVIGPMRRRARAFAPAPHRDATRAHWRYVRRRTRGRREFYFLGARVRGDDAHGSVSVSRTIGVAIDRVIDRGGSVDDDE